MIVCLHVVPIFRALFCNLLLCVTFTPHRPQGSKPGAPGATEVIVSIHAVVLAAWQWNRMCSNSGHLCWQEKFNGLRWSGAPCGAFEFVPGICRAHSAHSRRVRHHSLRSATPNSSTDGLDQWLCTVFNRSNGQN